MFCTSLHHFNDHQTPSPLPSRNINVLCIDAWLLGRQDNLETFANSHNSDHSLRLVARRRRKLLLVPEENLGSG